MPAAHATANDNDATVERDAAANQQVIRRIYDDCITGGRLELVPELISDDYIGPRGERGPAGFAGPLTALRNGFPDIQFAVADVVAAGDRVAVRWTWKATHTGAFNGIAPTGKQITNTGMAFYRLVDHKVVQSWVETDRLGALQQLGAVSEMVGRSPASQPPRR